MQNIIKIGFSIYFSLLISSLYSQVAFNTDSSSPDPSAMLDVKSTGQGVLTPRMSSLEREDIVNPTDGLLVYDTDEKSYFLFAGNKWKRLSSRTRRSIYISPTSVEGDYGNLLNPADRGKIGQTHTYDFPDNETTQILFTIPIPADYAGGLMTMKTIYTSENFGGEFRVSFGTRSFGVGDNVSLNAFGGSGLFAAPSSNRIAVGYTEVIFNGEGEILSCFIRRIGAAPNDTATGKLRIVGWVLEYLGL